MHRISNEEKAEHGLGFALHTIRQARFAEVRRKGKVYRARLAEHEVLAWEQHFGRNVWQARPSADVYVPSCDKHDTGKRHEFPRVPLACEPLACYLCGEGCSSKKELIQGHYKSVHCDREGLAPQRLEEEYRKQVFFYEERDGPFPVAGQEVRRAVSAHARHQTHSYPGTRTVGFDRPLTGGPARH